MLLRLREEHAVWYRVLKPIEYNGVRADFGSKLTSIGFGVQYQTVHSFVLKMRLDSGEQSYNYARRLE